MVGGALAAVNFLRLLFIVRTDYIIGILVSLTLMFTVVIAKLLGGMLPIAAKKLKLDPAIMAGPLITTIADALSLIVYFSMASILLGI
jgi:magnesium transporter